MEKKNNKKPRPTGGITVTQVAEAASAHARINIPLNLHAWRNLPEDIQADLLWFHQTILNDGLDWKAATTALGVHQSTIFRCLKGTYEGNWKNIQGAIRSYRELRAARSRIQQNVYVPNSYYDTIATGLSYALANCSITTISGESRLGKTGAAKHWSKTDGEGRAAFVTAPPIGGVKSLLRTIAGSIGVNKAFSGIQMIEAVYRGFNQNRILILDEAHRCLTSDTRTQNPALIELLRDIHDQTGCGLALIATRRFNERLRKGSYQYEQLIGRVGLPITLRNEVVAKDILPIVDQFLSANDDTIDVLLEIANKPGRLGIMVETLKVASRIAANDKRAVTDADVKKAVLIRRSMSGDT